MQALRVRQILGGSSTVTKTQLKKLLPSKLTMPTAETLRYPSALLKQLPAESAYAVLGCIAETLLRLPVAEITMEALLRAVQTWVIGVSASSLAAIRKSATTVPFIDACCSTRRLLDEAIGSGSAAGGPIQFDQELKSDCVVGHPDGLTATHVIEVKLTGQLKQGWTDFLLQAFAYAALAPPTVQTVCIVLPLQQTVWTTNVAGWKHRRAFLTLLNETSKQIQTQGIQDATIGVALRETYKIGFHVAKRPSIADTIATFPDYSKPYQIFLGSTQTSSLSLSDEQLQQAAAAVERFGAKVYVHTPYIINLSQETDGWASTLLVKHVQYSVAIGCKGVVVHVGKSTDKPVETALDNMRRNLLVAMEFATADCPVLLETPAGQGTETLTNKTEFIEFVAGFGDPRLRMCVDTCHVFSCGHVPLEYLETAVRVGSDSLIKLVHYNDSAVPCGACVDRHAFMGTGHIGMDGMGVIAKFCAKHSIPMVIE